eukprot:TRINITY_DN22715_c0_g1_i1.p1 TRINITY_DN22715_c0_g1~~TRINITY_DN22715_c0_g1_i1.p1  ORF type:complete len:477 (-),score=39.46 TRINITY_DN22715_c0_g1_i1:61-1491(-)
MCIRDRLYSYYVGDSRNFADWSFSSLGALPSGCNSMQYHKGYLLLACGRMANVYDIQGSSLHSIHSREISNTTNLKKLIISPVNFRYIYGIDPNAGLHLLNFTEKSLDWLGLVLPRRGLIDLIAIPNEGILWVLQRVEGQDMSAIEIYLDGALLKVNREVSLNGNFDTLKVEYNLIYISGPSSVVMLRHGIPSDGIPTNEQIRADLKVDSIIDLNVGYSRNKKGEITSHYMVSTSEGEIKMYLLERSSPILACRMETEGTSKFRLGIYSQSCEAASGYSRKDNICIFNHTVEVFGNEPLLDESRAVWIGLSIGLVFILVAFIVTYRLRKRYNEQMGRLNNDYNVLLSQASSQGSVPATIEVEMLDQGGIDRQSGPLQNTPGFITIQSGENLGNQDDAHFEDQLDENKKELDTALRLQKYNSTSKRKVIDPVQVECEIDGDPPIIENRHSDSILDREAEENDRFSFNINKDLSLIHI